MSALPHPILPMLATPGIAFDAPDHVFEIKWDGVRAIAYKDGTRFWLETRNLKPALERFPELEAVRDCVAAESAIIDGEIVVFSPDGRPNFDAVRARNAQRDPRAIARSRRELPSVFIAFDCLFHNGENLMPRPWRERRSRLEASLIPGDFSVLSKAVPESGTSLFAAVRERGLEGIVAKQVDSPYEPGRRSRHWTKVRNVRSADCVVGGFVPKGARSLKSLVLGLYDPPSGLVYVGHVGTGFTEAARVELRTALSSLRRATPPFALIPAEAAKDAEWVEPKWVCTVEFLTLTAHGHLRHPTYRGLRDDKAPERCLFQDELGVFAPAPL